MTDKPKSASEDAAPDAPENTATGDESALDAIKQAIEHVDAEVVSAKATDPGDDNDDAGDVGQPTVEEGAREADGAAPVRVWTNTTVLFCVATLFAFGVLAAVILSGGKGEAASVAGAGTLEEPYTLSTPAAAAPDESVAEKIINDVAREARRAASETAAAPTDAPALPPPPATDDANVGLRTAAKEYARSAAQADENDQTTEEVDDVGETEADDAAPAEAPGDAAEDETAAPDDAAAVEDADTAGGDAPGESTNGDADEPASAEPLTAAAPLATATHAADQTDEAAPEAGDTGVQSAADPSALDDAEARIARLQQDLATAEARLAEATETAAAREATLTEEMQSAAAAHAADLAAATDRIAGLEASLEAARAEAAQLASAAAAANAVSGVGAAQAARVLATANLKDAIERGEPFEQELSILAEVAPDMQGLDRIAPYAATGAPSLADLKTRFDPTARAAIAAADREAAASPVGAFIANIRSVISTRPADAKEGDDVRSVISRAEAALESNDLGVCLDELSGLKGAAAAAFEPWATDAEAHRVASEALSSLLRASE